MSDANQPYDPTAPEGDGGGSSQYVSRRDLRVILIGVVVLALFLLPFYRILERNSQKSRCVQNMKSIASALNQYAEVHDNRFPPLMRTALDGTPDLGDTGLPYTWASDIQEGMSARASFRCPSAQVGEEVYIEGRGRTRIPLTYGMYAPYGAFLTSIIANPDQTIIVAETSNFGTWETYNPTPFKTDEGKLVPYDAFVIGWSDSNTIPSPTSQYVTRLAFYGTANGDFREETEGRHDVGIHALNAQGAAAGPLKAKSAILDLRDGLPIGFWESPPVRRR